jgi:hypothetical protein
MAVLCHEVKKFLWQVKKCHSRACTSPTEVRTFHLTARTEAGGGSGAGDERVRAGRMRWKTWARRMRWSEMRPEATLQR